MLGIDAKKETYMGGGELATDWFGPFTRVNFEEARVVRMITNRNVTEFIEFSRRMLGSPLEVRALAVAFSLLKREDLIEAVTLKIKAFLKNIERLYLVDIDLADQLFLCHEYLKDLKSHCPNIKYITMDHFSVEEEFFEEIMSLDKLEHIDMKNVRISFPDQEEKFKKEGVNLSYYLAREEDKNRLKLLLDHVDFKTVHMQHKTDPLKYRTFRLL